MKRKTQRGKQNRRARTQEQRGRDEESDRREEAGKGHTQR